MDVCINCDELLDDHCPDCNCCEYFDGECFNSGCEWYGVNLNLLSEPNFTQVN